MRQKTRLGSIVIEALFLIPVILMIAFLMLNLQQSAKREMLLNEVVERTTLEVVDTLTILIALSNEEILDAALVELGMGALLGNPITPELKALLRSGHLKSTVLKAYFQDVFKRWCEALAIEAFAIVTTENNGLIIEAGIKPISYAYHQDFFSHRSIRIRAFCEGLEAYLLSHEEGKINFYLTPYGISESGCYHTHYCWSLKQAKEVIAIALDRLPETFPDYWYWQGKGYRICGFCYEEQWMLKGSQ